MIKLSIEQFIKLDNQELINKTIAFSTDTIFGVGAPIGDEEAIKKIYKMKNRDINKPLAVLVKDLQQAKLCTKEIPKNIVEIIDQYWPGALTIVLHKSSKISEYISKTNTVGIRMPNSKIALQVLTKLGPMATTSINISNEVALNDVLSIEENFKSDIDYLITDTVENLQIASTVIDGTIIPFKVLRLGNIKL